MSTGLTKKQIRSKILLRLKTHKEEDRERKSKIIKNKLFRTSSFKSAKILMFYLSFGGEVDTKEMIKAATKLGKIVVVPVCEHNRIIIKPSILTHKARLEKGPHGVHEPAVKYIVNKNDLDLVIVPGLAFDKKGNRLGRGKGCYDYFLKQLPKKIPSIGLAYSFQILPGVPATKDDVKVDKVIFA